MATGLPLMKIVLTPLAKTVLVPLGLTAAVLGTDAAIQKKTLGSGTTALIISNEEMKHIMKIVKYVSEINKDKVKEQKVGFFSMLVGTLAAGSLGNMLTGKPKIPA